MKSKIVYSLIGAIVVLAILSPFFLKVKVECQSQYGSCPAEITDSLAALNNKSLIQARNRARGILGKSLLVSDYSSQFKLPNILTVNLLIKKPEFAIRDKTTGKIGLVDRDGKIISVTEDSGLPTLIVASEDIKVGNSLSKEELFDLKLVRGVWEMYQVGSGEVQNNTLVIELPVGVTVIFPQDGDSDIMLGALRLIYGKIESPELAGKYSQIDLRFKNPVLR